MSKDVEFSILENTLARMLTVKKETDFDEKNWDEWFDFILNSYFLKKKQSE